MFNWPKYCYFLMAAAIFLLLPFKAALSADSLQLDQMVWQPDYTLDSLIIIGDTHFPLTTVRNELKLDQHQQQPFSPLKAEQLIAEIVDYYLDQGFPFCRVSIEKIAVDDSLKKVSLAINLNTGRITTISFIRYDGLKSNRPLVLNRQTRLKLPFIFDRSILKSAEQYLYSSELFNEYPGWQIVQNQENSFGISYQISEDKYNSLDAVLGYSQNDGDRSGLRGKVELYFRNLLGSMRQLKINWLRQSDQEESILLFYKEPWLLNIPLAASVSFTQEFQDKQYLERYYSLGADYQANYRLTLLADYTYGEIMPDSLLIQQGEKRAEKQIVGAGLNYRIFNRQQEFLHSDFKLSSILKSYQDGQQDNGYLLHWLNEWQKKIAGPFYIKQQLRLEFTGADSLSAYDLLKFGGHSSLRGYFEGQYQTDLYLLNRNDLIWRAADNTELFLFGDLAGYDTNHKIRNWESMNFLSGYGAGLRFNNNLGRFEVSYGIASDEGAETAKLHFQYINEF